MEWNEMEWNGMEWNGMEWNGMEWNGMESAFIENRNKKCLCFLWSHPFIGIRMNISQHHL